MASMRYPFAGTTKKSAIRRTRIPTGSDSLGCRHARYERPGDPAPPVERLADLMSGGFDNHREHLHEIDVVIDDEHLHAGRLPLTRGARQLLPLSCRDRPRQTDHELRPPAFAFAVRFDRPSMHVHQLSCQLPRHNRHLDALVGANQGSVRLCAMDAFEGFKAAQRAGWAHFGPLQGYTTEPAARLVRHAGIEPGHRVLDVACGTGVVAVTAARGGAHVTGLDLTPELLVAARENARLASVDIDWHEGDVEQLPFDTAMFDVVVSQFGHMFAPQPDVAIREMLRVLRPGGIIAFSTWPPELLVGRLFALTARYLPPPPPGAIPPSLWGDPNTIRERLGAAVRNISFDHGVMRVPALSLRHHAETFERTAGPVIKVVETLRAGDPDKLQAFRAEADAINAEYYRDNVLRQGYLMTRATKV
jgi:2-polyprenyl-3-methyl-5-hydroxy-6-metoxy-1,4-benzoquinol methylase